MEVQGEGKRSRKRITKGMGAKTGWSAVCPMIDRHRTGPQLKCGLSVSG